MKDQERNTYLYLVDQAKGNGLGGDNYRKYLTAAIVTEDQESGAISAHVASRLHKLFAKRDVPRFVAVCRVDTANGVSYIDALDAIWGDVVTYYIEADDPEQSLSLSKFMHRASLAEQHLGVGIFQNADFLSDDVDAVRPVHEEKKTCPKCRSVLTETRIAPWPANYLWCPGCEGSDDPYTVTQSADGVVTIDGGGMLAQMSPSVFNILQAASGGAILPAPSFFPGFFSGGESTLEPVLTPTPDASAGVTITVEEDLTVEFGEVRTVLAGGKPISGPLVLTIPSGEYFGYDFGIAVGGISYTIAQLIKMGKRWAAPQEQLHVSFTFDGPEEATPDEEPDDEDDGGFMTWVEVREVFIVDLGDGQTVTVPAGQYGVNEGVTSRGTHYTVGELVRMNEEVKRSAEQALAESDQALAELRFAANQWGVDNELLDYALYAQGGIACFRATADIIAQAERHEQLGMARDAFGRVIGRKLLALLCKGSKGMDEMALQARELGGFVCADPPACLCKLTRQVRDAWSEDGKKRFVNIEASTGGVDVIVSVQPDGHPGQLPDNRIVGRSSAEDINVARREALQAALVASRGA